MITLSAKLARGLGNRLVFHCPGCDSLHAVAVDEHGIGPRWTWNGDLERPTLSPSILVQWDRWVPPATTLEMRDKIASGEVVQRRERHVCHSFVREGQVLFLGDCTHALAGRTVPLPDLAEWDRD